jgi:hypothetical protein
MLKLGKAPDWAYQKAPETGSALQEVERVRPRNEKLFAWLLLANVSITEGTEKGGFVRDVPATTQPDEVETVALRVLFSKTYSKDPQGTIDLLIQQVSRGSSRQAATEVILPYLARAGYGRQNMLIAALQAFASPSELIRAALAVNQVRPDREMLQATAGLLEHYGSKAWQALVDLARSGRSECRFFTRQIAECDDIPVEQRRDAITALAANPDLDTRWEVVELLDGGWLSDPNPVWQVLRDDPDERIKTIARARLENPATRQ